MSTFDAPTYDDGLPASGRSQPGDRNLMAQAAWGGGGFLLGVIVWHFIGFWSFISTVVFRGPDNAGVAITQAAQPATRSSTLVGKRQQTVLGTAPAQAPPATPSTDCTALVLDRTAGTTSLSSCEAAAEPMRVVMTSQRGDRHNLASSRDDGWSVVVDAEADVTPVTSIDAKLDPSFGQRAVQLD